MEGLLRLEYGGYDSAGFACLNPQDNRIVYVKTQGNVQSLLEKFDQCPIDGYLGIGQTRWATHGILSQENAHPHFDCYKQVSIVHNGIIENYHDLKVSLQNAGHFFYSATDTEVVAHVLEDLLKESTSCHVIISKLVKRIEGAYAILVMMEAFPDQIILIRKKAPLSVGIGDDEMFIASDVFAFSSKTNKAVFLPDESFAIVKKNAIYLYDFSGNALPFKVQEIEKQRHDFSTQGYAHYMLKEIYEQKQAIRATVDFLKNNKAYLWDQIGLSVDYIKNLSKLHIIGCGTSWHAARIGQFFFEHIAQLPTRVHLASEFRYMSFFKDNQSAYLAISQSGETADTLEALRLVNSAALPTIALTNIASSTIVREAGGFLLTQAGREIAVASTKAFSTQLAVFYWLAHMIGYAQGKLTQQHVEQAEEDLYSVAEILENSIEYYKTEIVHTHAPRYARYTKAIFLGRHIGYPFALEAALKLKEIAYIFSQCYPAGELKHGPLALVDEQTPIFLFSQQDPLIYQKLVANAQEVKARGGHLVAFICQGQEELYRLADTVFIFPHVKPLLEPLAMTGLMQFFVYAIAKELGRPIDKPRNLAKSVTVE
jgi:glucosamine--fructose-6-phosphate aminotransferase (isomerizing)